MIYLFWNSPIAKFWMFQFFYINFLFFFSLAVIFPGCGNWNIDVIVCIWMANIVIEHIINTFSNRHSIIKFSMFKYLETIIIIIFVILFTLTRVIGLQLLSPYKIKVILCLGLIYFYYRLFAVYMPISPTLGPLLYRLRVMMLVDFLNFLKMALLVLISNGIVIQVLLFPDQPLTLDMFRKMYHRAFFTLFLTPADELERKSLIQLDLFIYFDFS